MPAPNRLVTDTELDVLKALWALEAGTVREVLEELGNDWAYTTAQTLLGRLQEKGCVASEKRGRAFVFRPTVSRDELLGQSLDELAARVCDGKSLPLMLNLVQSSKFSRKDLEQFRELLDELEGGQS